MTPQGSWPNWPISLALDSSAVINLNASGKAAEILLALGCEVVVACEVFEELRSGFSKGRTDGEKLAVLVEQAIVTEVALGPRGLTLFEQLTIGTAAATLDDGEAATIALAFERETAAVIDDRKGRQLCATHAPMVQLICSIEMFVHEAVMKALDHAQADAIFCALTEGRMHVLPAYHARVLDLLGAERAALCKSLPREVRARR